MALHNGAARVVFAGCVEANCRYPHARELMDRHISRLKDTLAVLTMESALVVLGESSEEDVHLR
jgi:coenzyme F420-reducing hydrogenase delta subunit